MFQCKFWIEIIRHFNDNAIVSTLKLPWIKYKLFRLNLDTPINKYSFRNEDD